MRRSTMGNGLVFLLLLLLAAVLPAQAAEGPAFDLKVDLNLSAIGAGALRPDDVVRLTLRPETRQGAPADAEPVVLERHGDSAGAGEWRFRRALQPGALYSVELTLIRGGDTGEQVVARYLSALDRLPRRAARHPLGLQLRRVNPRDARHTVLMVDRDSDGVYRLMIFTA